MIECPTCKHREFVGTLFCSECGTQLVQTMVPAVESNGQTGPDLKSITTKPTAPDGSHLEPGAVIGLRIVSSGEMLSLLGRTHYTLGRSSKDQAIIPDVDLSSFQAYDRGVSRLHAEIRIQDERLNLIDLDSANGTMINGVRLEPQIPIRIRHGDIIQLGRMRLQLISRYS